MEELKNELHRAHDDDATTLEKIKDIRRRLCTAFREEGKILEQKKSATLAEKKEIKIQNSSMLGIESFVLKTGMERGRKAFWQSSEWQHNTFRNSSPALVRKTKNLHSDLLPRKFMIQQIKILQRTPPKMKLERLWLTLTWIKYQGQTA
ncbi:unnamed protein product [Arabis nemorensis]|uniref:Uncharacterized protein n=1 Tax=Arabis nemorensis TaxID=586526 RepID=A0A565AYP5_9BRAS|nr:unnamed protein product [Arabis nemorensis]